MSNRHHVIPVLGRLLQLPLNSTVGGVLLAMILPRSHAVFQGARTSRTIATTVAKMQFVLSGHKLGSSVPPVRDERWAPTNNIVFANSSRGFTSQLATADTSDLDHTVQTGEEIVDHLIEGLPDIVRHGRPREPSATDLPAVDAKIKDRTWRPMEMPIAFSSLDPQLSPSVATIQARIENLKLEPDEAQRNFTIPEDILRKAMLASPSSGAAYWHYKLYQSPTGEKVKVHYCRNLESSERVAQLFLGHNLIGFDIEWKPASQVGDGIKKNISLLQIANQERIALFHIALYRNETIEDLVAPTLRHIMESPEVTKVGVGIKADCTRLRTHLDIQSQSIFELSHLYKLVKYSSTNVTRINKMLVSLAQQVEEHLQLPLNKGEVRTGDWSRELGKQQVDYAASDSYAAVQLFKTLEAKRLALKPTPPRPAHAELNLPIALAEDEYISTDDELDDLLCQTESVSSQSESIS